MELKEYLMQNELFRALPDTLPKLIASRDTVDMACFLTFWHAYIRRMPSSGKKKPLTPRRMFECYKDRPREGNCGLGIIMRLWWNDTDESGKTNGEALKEILKAYITDQKGDISAAENLDVKQFEELFEDVDICTPVADFYSFFNPQTGVIIKHPDLPRTKNIPLIGSRRSISHKFNKHFYRVEDYLTQIYKDFYKANRFDGKDMNEYISDTIVSAVSDALR